eukprot:jgi/Bigna1/146632/aug1.118_g21340
MLRGKYDSQYRVLGDSLEELTPDRIRVYYNDEEFGLLRRLQAGAKKMGKVIQLTMGPRGRNVVVGEEPGPKDPRIINDGFSISFKLKLEDPIENLGARIVATAGDKTNLDAGDGTSTAMVMAAAIINEGVRVIVGGANPRTITAGISKAEQYALDILKDVAKESTYEDLKTVALVSSGYDYEATDAIIKAFDEVRKSHSWFLGTDIAHTHTRGWIREELVNDVENSKWVAKNPYVLLVNDPIERPDELIPVLKWAQENDKALLIMAEDYGDKAIQGITLAKLKGGMNVCAIRAPGFLTYNEENLQDIASLSNGTVFDSIKGTTIKKNFHPDDLGQISAAEISRSMTKIYGDRSSKEEVEKRAQMLTQELDWMKDKIMSGYDDKDGSLKDAITEYTERLGRLTSGIAVVEIGSNTDLELKERLLRVEDALMASRAAIKDGVLPGGGSVLIHVSKKLLELSRSLTDESDRLGALILSNAMKAPLRNIANNAGYSGDMVIRMVEDAQEGKGLSMGYDAATGDIVDMFEAGIIDPARATRAAIENSASVARSFFTVDGLVRDKLRAIAGV